ncbi:MAG: hypothetical protein XD91_1614 [Clostridiales bacterium 38_11]|nr:MAG: hypothetical protein XD91_1614 [Clostridiales bacterium 38_11]
MVSPFRIGIDDRVHVLLCQLVAVGDLDAFLGRIDEEGAVLFLGLFQYHDTGRYARAEEQIAGQLNDAVDIVIINQVLAYLLFGTASIHDTREADNGGCTAGCKL